MENPSIGIAIENMSELTELIKKAQRQNAELQETLDKIQMFQPEIIYR